MLNAGRWNEMSGPGATPAPRLADHIAVAPREVSRSIWPSALSACDGAPRRRLLSALPLAFIIAGCAIDSTIPPEIRTTTVQVQVPVPVPCFTDAQRPVAPTPTTIDPETATTEQLAAAELADAEAWRDYTRSVDALFLQCSSKGTP